MFSFLIFKDLRARKHNLRNKKNHVIKQQNTAIRLPVKEEVYFIKARKLLLFFVKMGNCQSRLCCTADRPENTSPKTARSEKSANLELDSCSPNSERLSPYSVSDRLNRMKELCQNERALWHGLQSMVERAEEERIAHGLKSPTNNVCKDDPSHSLHTASKRVEKHKEATAKSKKVDGESRREFIRQLQRTVWKGVNERIMKAREVALARRENEENQGASTSAQNPSCNVSSSDEWLINHPCLFDAISCTEDDDDEENCSQSSATGHAANSVKFKMFFRESEPEEPSEKPEFDSVSPVQELHAEIAENKPEGSALNCSTLSVSTDHKLSTEGDDHRTSSSGWFSPGPSPSPSPRPRALTRVLRRRWNNCVESMVSSSGSETKEDVLPPGQTPTPSPENRADRRGGFLRGVFSRIGQRRSNRVHDVTSSGNPQSPNNSSIRGNSQSSNVSALQSTPQNSNSSPLTRAWLNILGRSSPPTSGRVTQILVRPYDENQAKKGCPLLSTVTAAQVLASSASAEHRSRVEVSAPPSPVRSVVSFEIENDIEVCSFTSNSSIDARPADFGGT